MSKIGFAIALLGVAGLGGYAETGEGLIASIALIIIGGLACYISEKGGKKQDKRTNTYCNNCHDYPAGLYAGRRA